MIIAQTAQCIDPVTGHTLVVRATHYVHTDERGEPQFAPDEVFVVFELVDTPAPSRTAAAGVLADIEPGDFT